jgi:DNA-binding LacI/PurR family transcriptional regulator
MVSIKEVAAAAKVSSGTASVVLNGRGDELRISQATQKRIWEVAKSLGYRPNISARRLRSGDDTGVPVIALFWTLDTRSLLMSRFLRGIQAQFSKWEFDLLIQPFEASKLKNVESLNTVTRFNGAIITNATEEDEEFLNTADLNVPIVLHLRDSLKYSSVNIDNYRSGMEVARLFASRGHVNVGLIVPNVSSSAIRLRKEGFISGAEQYGLTLTPDNIIHQDFSEEGGVQGTFQMFGSNKNPTAIFVLSDQMATGTLFALHQLGVRVPEDVEIVGHDNYDSARYTIPSLSTIHLPVEEMAGSCIELLMNIMSHRLESPQSISFDTHLIVRNSCGGFKEPRL